MLSRKFLHVVDNFSSFFPFFPKGNTLTEDLKLLAKLHDEKRNLGLTNFWLSFKLCLLCVLTLSFAHKINEAKPRHVNALWSLSPEDHIKISLDNLSPRRNFFTKIKLRQNCSKMWTKKELQQNLRQKGNRLRFTGHLKRGATFFCPEKLLLPHSLN